MDSFPEVAGFAQGCNRGELRIPRCGRCGRFSWPPRPRCRHCHSADLNYARVGTDARVYSWVVIHPTSAARSAGAQGTDRQRPYAVVIAALNDDPGTRLVGRFTASPNRLSPNLAVRAVFTPSATVPSWAPAPR